MGTCGLLPLAVELFVADQPSAWAVFNAPHIVLWCFIFGLVKSKEAFLNNRGLLSFVQVFYAVNCVWVVYMLINKLEIDPPNGLKNIVFCAVVVTVSAFIVFSISKIKRAKRWIID